MAISSDSQTAIGSVGAPMIAIGWSWSTGISLNGNTNLVNPLWDPGHAGVGGGGVVVAKMGVGKAR